MRSWQHFQPLELVTIGQHDSLRPARGKLVDDTLRDDNCSIQGRQQVQTI